jgi:hypothetical protein
MTTQDRVQAVADYRFTDRQAKFLILVMRHSGLCIKRQYGAFAGIKSGGDTCNAFFARLVRRGFAVTAPCIHNRARLYHVHHKPLYHAIGEPDSRFRRAVPARQVVTRLMRLDAAMTSPDADWLTSRADKSALLAAKRAVAADQADAAAVEGVEPLPGTLPIGVDREGRLLVLYVVTVPWTDDFRVFLLGHVPVLAASPTWTLRLMFPPALHRVVPDYENAVREELASPLGDLANEVNWYFFHRHRETDWREYASPALPEKFRRYTKAFSGPRFALLYRRWLTHQQAALAPVSPRLTEAWHTGRGTLDCVVLPHDYEPFSPLVSPRRAQHRRKTVEAKDPDIASRGQNRVLNLGS